MANQAARAWHGSSTAGTSTERHVTPGHGGVAVPRSAAVPSSRPRHGTTRPCRALRHDRPGGGGGLRGGDNSGRGGGDRRRRPRATVAAGGDKWPGRRGRPAEAAAARRDREGECGPWKEKLGFFLFI